MSKGYPKLNFPPIKIKAQRHPDGQTISAWSSIRNIFVVLTPEEWVRRHLVEYLLAECGVNREQIVEEYPVNLNGQPQRADVVVIGSSAKPEILVECKAPEVKITKQTFDQAVRYNSVVGARYIILTNGLTHLCFDLSEGEYRSLDHFPTL